MTIDAFARSVPDSHREQPLNEAGSPAVTSNQSQEMHECFVGRRFDRLRHFSTRRFARSLLFVVILFVSIHGFAATEADPRLRSGYQYIAAAHIIHPSYVDGAVTLFSQVAAADEENVEAQVMAALAFDVVRNDPRAIAHYRNAARFSNDPAFIVLWADYLVRAGDLDAAESIYHDALAIDEDYTAAWLGLGRVELAREKPAAAAEFLEKAFALSPGRLDVRAYLARAYLGLGRPHDALALLESPEGNITRPVVYYTTLAHVQATLGDAEGACVSIERIGDAWTAADIGPLLEQFACRRP